MRSLLIINILLISLLAFGQIKVDTLDNQLRFVYVQDTTKRIYISVFIRYPAIKSYGLIGLDRIFAELTGSQVVGYTLLQRNLVTDSLGVDSAMRFLYYELFERRFEKLEVNRVKQALREMSFEQKVSKIVAVGRRSPISLPVSIYIGPDTLHRFRRLFSADNMAIVVRTGVEYSYIRGWVDSVWSGVSNVSVPIKRVSGYRKPVAVNLIDVNDTVFRVGFTYPIYFSVNEQLLANHFLVNYLKLKGLNVDVNFSEDVQFLSFIELADSLDVALKKILKVFKSLKDKEISTSELIEIKKLMLSDLESWDRDYFLFNRVLFLSLLKNQSFDFFRKYKDKIRSLDFQKVKDLKFKNLYDSSQLIIIGPKDSIECYLLKLSKDYTIYIYDHNVYRYDVIPKVFSAWTVINQYLRFVAPYKVSKNLFYEFEGYFFVDSIFLKIKGFTWKKYPNLYRFQTFLLLPEDTIFHYMLIFDGKEFWDSTYYGLRSMSSNERAELLYKTYILADLYYKKFNYKVQLLCNKIFLSQKIYPIKVQPPENYYFIEYYYTANQTKLYTQVFADTLRPKWQYTLYYDDYKRIGTRTTNFKIPFYIKEQSPFYTLELQITSVSTKSIPKKVFRPDYNPLAYKKRRKK